LKDTENQKSMVVSNSARLQLEKDSYAAELDAMNLILAQIQDIVSKWTDWTVTLLVESGTGQNTYVVTGELVIGSTVSSGYSVGVGLLVFLLSVFMKM